MLEHCQLFTDYCDWFVFLFNGLGSAELATTFSFQRCATCIPWGPCSSSQETRLRDWSPRNGEEVSMSYRGDPAVSVRLMQSYQVLALRSLQMSDWCFARTVTASTSHVYLRNFVSPGRLLNVDNAKPENPNCAIILTGISRWDGLENCFGKSRGKELQDESGPRVASMMPVSTSFFGFASGPRNSTVS